MRQNNEKTIDVGSHGDLTVRVESVPKNAQARKKDNNKVKNNLWPHALHVTRQAFHPTMPATIRNMVSACEPPTPVGPAPPGLGFPRLWLRSVECTGLGN